MEVCLLKFVYFTSLTSNGDIQLEKNNAEVYNIFYSNTKLKHLRLYKYEEVKSWKIPELLVPTTVFQNKEKQTKCL